MRTKIGIALIIVCGAAYAAPGLETVKELETKHRQLLKLCSGIALAKLEVSEPGSDTQAQLAGLEQQRQALVKEFANPRSITFLQERATVASGSFERACTERAISELSK
jgi:hypothetical protein